ncbi:MULTISPECIES: hypothetical protein [unclassified Moorena]|uniref:hypothetical protein n=1 Tax=unclassified Moorena TaxID=2683338 RepID=UPI0013CBBF3A|nr:MULTISPECIES: hypothetical protein [unclassified Moorena]NEP36454.1 hypothetical protein [Moorena sp. SIO3B2]NES44786.1 hypothetical protein [Moorena sp. SIO2C4]
MSETISIGGTANIRAIDESNFSVAMTGVFDGGVYAKVTGSQDLPDGKKKYDLKHYFVTNDGSYLYTEDTSIHTPVEDNLYMAQTEYNIVEAGGKFKGLKGSFKSWGAMDYSRGVGVLCFEGEI